MFSYRELGIARWLFGGAFSTPTIVLDMMDILSGYTIPLKHLTN